MTRKVINTNQAQTTVGVETTFGTAATTLKRIYPKEGISLEINQIEVEDLSESIYLFDQKDTVSGYKSGGAKLGMYLAPLSAQIGVASTPAYTDSGDSIVLKTVYGGYSAHGSANITGGTISTVIVDDPTKFEVGQWVLVPYSSKLYPAKVTAINANTLSIYPDLPGAPSNATVCVNMENFYPTENNTSTFTLEHAKAEDTSIQYRLLGCIANGNVKISKNENLMFEAEVKAADWQQGSLSIPITEGTNSRTAPMFANDAMVLFQPVATTTRTNYTLLSMDLKTEFSNIFLEEFGGVQGKTGPVRNGKRGIVELSIKLAMDPDQYTYFDTKTPMFFAYAASKGSGLSRRFVIVDVANCTFKEIPKISEESGIMYLEGVLVGKLNTDHTSDLSRAPTVLAMG
jgi:hypothetical protein